MLENIQTLLCYFVMTATAPFLAFSLLVIADGWYNKVAVRNIARVIVLLFGVTAIGTCAGFAGGMSRTGAVGNIIPAALALLGGLAVYLFGVDSTRGAIASITGGCLAVSLFFSYAVGAQLRNWGDDVREERAFCAKAYSDGSILGKKEALDAFEMRFRDRCKQRLPMRQL